MCVFKKYLQGSWSVKGKLKKLASWQWKEGRGVRISGWWVWDEKRDSHVSLLSLSTLMVCSVSLTCPCSPWHTYSEKNTHTHNIATATLMSPPLLLPTGGHTKHTKRHEATSTSRMAKFLPHHPASPYSQGWHHRLVGSLCSLLLLLRYGEKVTLWSLNWGLPGVFSSVLLCIKVWLNFIIKPTGFTVWSTESEERVMTLQTRLFTGLLAAAASSLPASTEQQQPNSATFLLSVNRVFPEKEFE